MKTRSFSQLLAIVVITSIFTGISAFGQQTRAAKGSSGPKATPTAGCRGGWSGIVTYKRTLKDSLESDEPGIRKSIDRIKHKTSRDYDYTARAVIDGSDPKNPAVSTNVNFTDTDLSWGEERVFDTCNSRENGHWFVIEGTDDRQTQAQASGPAESFNLSVDEMGGTYNFSMAFPKAKGIFKREEHVKKSGHCQAKNNEPYNRSTNDPFTIEGGSFTIDSQKIDPKDPDHLTGTKVWGDDGSGPVRSFIHQVTWRFTRCPQKLLITELKFEHPKFPNFEDWKPIENPKGTIDGNKIKVKAKVLNMSAETKYADLKIVETYKGDKYNYARPDESLPEAESSFRIDAGEEKEFEFIWDSEGQAWFDDGRPHLLHRIKAELSEGSQVKDKKEEPLNIAPKPLILVHGLWSDYRVWVPLYQNLLTTTHSYNWKAYAVGENAHFGAMAMGRWNEPNWYSDSIYDNAVQLTRYIKHAQEDSNAWHVDMVAHSLGGLVGRLYLQKHMPNVPDGRPQVKHLIMLGTPNGGVPCVDVLFGKLDLFKKDLRAARELTNDEMLRFNQYVVNTGGAKLSALAGNPVPIVCGGMEWNDGFVTVRSATYGVADKGEANDLNYQLTNGKNFGNFVQPHLITGPKGTYPYPVNNDPTDWRRWQLNNGDYDVNNGSGSDRVRLIEPIYSPGRFYAELIATGGKPHGPNAFESLPLVADGSFTKELKLAPKQTVEVEVPIDAGPVFGLTFIASSGVSVSLLNDRGVLVSRSMAGSPLSNSMFRMLLTQRAVAGATWKLKIENTTDLEQPFAGFSWSMDALPIPGNAGAGRK